MRISDWSSDVCSSDLPATSWKCCATRTANSPSACTTCTRSRRKTSASPCRPSSSPSTCCARTAPRPQCARWRSEEHTSELQSLMRISYAVFCLKKKTKINNTKNKNTHTQHQHKKNYED